MRIDFYTHVHKSQRNQMFALATDLSKIDAGNASHLLTVEPDLRSLITGLRNHAYHEETFIHPLLNRRLPTSAKALDHDHEELEVYLTQLENGFDYLLSLNMKHPKIGEQILEYYRGFNRFIANYLMHINEEECILQNLWEITDYAELLGMMIAFQTYDGIEKGRKWLTTNMKSMNIDEQLLMFQTIKLMAPQEISKIIFQMAQEIIDEANWKLINMQLDNFI